MTDTFQQETDRLGNTFFTHIEQPGSPLLSDQLRPARSESGSQYLTVSPLLQNRFTSDLTPQDDILLAFFALLLLLVIQAITTTILLRTTHAGTISTFSFSVKQIIELIREFKLQTAIRPQESDPALSTPTLVAPPSETYCPDDSAEPPRLNYAVITLACFILAFTFGLEISALFLTNPYMRHVTNERATLRFRHPVLPQWQDIQFHNRASFNRPCIDVTMVDVEPGKTRINVCATSSVPGTSFELFEQTTKRTLVQMQSDLHEYGAQHTITIGDLTARFSARVYFSLGDGLSRTMSHIRVAEAEKEAIQVVHRQFIAFLFNAYLLSVADEEMNLDRLNNEVSFSYSNASTESIVISRVGEGVTSVTPMRYITNATGVIPSGSAALRVGQHFFRASIAVSTVGPNITDLFTESGMRSVSGVVWSESVRLINWLSLVIILVVAMVILGLLRTYLKPAATADIAGAFVKQVVGADLNRSPLELRESEKEAFRLSDDWSDSEDRLTVTEL